MIKLTQEREMTMGLKYSKDYTVSYFDADVNSNMKLPNLMSVALEVSGEQSSVVGRSDKYLIDTYGCAWVVLEYKFEITRLPVYEEKLKIVTEATSYNKFFTYRDFVYYDQDGQELVKISSTWSLMNLQERKIENITDEIVAPYHSEKLNKLVRGNKYKRLEDYTIEHPYSVRFYDLDINGHVNNTKYFDWLVDVLDDQFLTDYEPTTMYFKYIKEIHYGSQVESKVLVEDLTTYHEIYTGSEKNAQAEIIWRKRNK
ncbi:acyl-[acyl-carrier-protein] thioesterase [Floricoccus penangensis]|uniref:acyl-[acyl-carrier-protein] thioesterase n=1 Tax=Floricoccus penangensis TaxID=1859475 RepID=UPI0020417B9F|nr:acyl-ACP thioesterase domain-containing protein [Floricoccus penangensis]URZ88005.1 acyl-[acyl-carrier-protein] thioesterase [Floricoccus penangensis]